MIGIIILMVGSIIPLINISPQKISPKIVVIKTYIIIIYFREHIFLNIPDFMSS